MKKKKKTARGLNQNRPLEDDEATVFISCPLEKFAPFLSGSSIVASTCRETVNEFTRGTRLRKIDRTTDLRTVDSIAPTPCAR